jgi:hypothetical protein
MGWLDKALGPVLGFGGALLSSQKAADSGKEMADVMRANASRLSDMAQPYVEQGAWALPRLQGYASTLEGLAGKESPLLRGKYLESLKGIDENEKAAEADASAYFGAAGNSGRARGEKLRARQSALQAKNLAGLSYGAAQEDYKQASRDRYGNALGSLLQAGGMGLGTAQNALGMSNQAAGARADAQQGFYGDLASLIGTGVGQYNDAQRWRDWMRLNPNGTAKKGA